MNKQPPHFFILSAVVFAVVLADAVAADLLLTQEIRMTLEVKPTESITWQTTTYVQDANKIKASNFAVSGCSRTHVERGVVNFTLTWVYSGKAYGFCTYKVEIVELELIIGQQSGVKLYKRIPVDFSIPFGPLTQGGLLTMKLSVYNIN